MIIISDNTIICFDHAWSFQSISKATEPLLVTLFVGHSNNANNRLIINVCEIVEWHLIVHEHCPCNNGDFWAATLSSSSKPTNKSIFFTL